MPPKVLESSQPTASGRVMHSKREAITIYRTVGMQLMTVLEDDLRQAADETGMLLLPDIEPSVPKRLHQRVRRSKSVEDAIAPALEAEALGIRASESRRLRAVMLYRQALSTLMELATSKYGEKDRVAAIGRQLDSRMPELLGLDV